MDSPHATRLRLNEAVYGSFLRHGIVRRTVRKWTLPGLGLVCFAMFLNQNEVIRSLGDASTLFAVFLVAAALIVCTVLGLAFAVVFEWAMVPKVTKAFFAEEPDIRDDASISLSLDGGVIEYRTSSHRFAWAEVAMWDEAADFMAIWKTVNQVVVLPKSDLSMETINFVRTMLIASGLTNPRKARS